MSLDVTPYLTEVEADEYFATVLDVEAWEDADSSSRLKALKMATTKIDQLPYIGIPATEEHAFPRESFYEPKVGDGGVVHNDVKKACCELALAYLDGTDPDADFSDQKVISEGFSSVRATYDKDFQEFHKLLGLTRKAYLFLLPWLDLGINPVNITRIT